MRWKTVGTTLIPMYNCNSVTTPLMLYTIINGAQGLLKNYLWEQNLQGFQNTLLGQRYLFSVLATDRIKKPFCADFTH